MDNTNGGSNPPAGLEFVSSWGSNDEVRRQRLALTPTAVEQDLIFWLDAITGDVGEDDEEGIGPLDVWERQWSSRIMPRLHQLLSLNRLQSPRNVSIQLKVSASELGFLACRMIAVRRLFRILFQGNRDGYGRFIQLGTLPDTWKQVFAAVTPVTPYPALASREWLESEVIPNLMDDQCQQLTAGSRQLLAVVNAAVRSRDQPDVLILAPLGVLVHLYEMAVESRVRAIDGNARQRADRTLAIFRITLTEEIVERGRA